MSNMMLTDIETKEETKEDDMLNVMYADSDTPNPLTVVKQSRLHHVSVGEDSVGLQIYCKTTI